jgi:hypothetical protein
MKALRALDEENGRKPDAHFYVWAIVERAYALSPDLQRVEQERQQRSAAHQRWWEEKAAAGNSDAKLYLASGRSLRRGALSPRRRRSFPSWVEAALNPSRTLAALADRGLVQRYAVKGGGAAALTEEGRNTAL